MISIALAMDSAQPPAAVAGAAAAGPKLPGPQNLSAQEVSAFQRALAQPDPQASREAASSSAGPMPVPQQPGSLSEFNALARDRWMAPGEDDADHPPQEDAESANQMPPAVASFMASSVASLPTAPKPTPLGSGPVPASRASLAQSLVPAMTTASEGPRERASDAQLVFEPTVVHGAQVTAQALRPAELSAVESSGSVAFAPRALQDPLPKPVMPVALEMPREQTSQAQAVFASTSVHGAQVPMRPFRSDVPTAMEAPASVVSAPRALQEPLSAPVALEMLREQTSQARALFASTPTHGAQVPMQAFLSDLPVAMEAPLAVAPASSASKDPLAAPVLQAAGEVPMPASPQSAQAFPNGVDFAAAVPPSSGMPTASSTPEAAQARPERAVFIASDVSHTPPEKGSTPQPGNRPLQSPPEPRLAPLEDRSQLESATLTDLPLGAAPVAQARAQAQDTEAFDPSAPEDTPAASVRADLPVMTTPASLEATAATPASARVDAQAVREVVGQVRRTLAQRDLEALDAGRAVVVSLPQGLLPVERLELKGDGQGGLAQITLVAATALEGDLLSARVGDLRVALAQDVAGVRIEVRSDARSDAANMGMDAQNSSTLSGGASQDGQGSQQPSREDVLQALDQIQRRASVATAGQWMEAASDFQRRVVAGE